MQKSIYKPVLIWLIIGALMVASMVVIGGITRLTDSGLSMVDWNLFSGTIPPSSEGEWQETFDAYKNYPEYKLVNFDMSLAEFKSIFFWEWFHRVLGRLIGIVFIIPFVYFLVKKKLDPVLKRRLWVLLALGAFQGFLGWFMVKSGLKDQPDVSHFRLAIHLCAAFLTFTYILWLVLDLTQDREEGNQSTINPIRRMLPYLIPLIIVQIIYGAFVAGMDAGLVFPSWPKMGEFWVPPQIGIALEKTGLASFWNEKVSVQFVHRILAYLVFIVVTITWFKGRRLTSTPKTEKALNWLMIAILLQVVIGIGTLVMKVPIFMGVLHQLMALVVLSCLVYLIFITKRNIPKINIHEPLGHR